jgi:glycine oxidase
VKAPARSALVVGGGVIGTTSAYRLARAGWTVTLIDPAPGAGASWAAAGMVAPTAEIEPGEKENFTLQRHALVAWRDLASELETLTGDVVTLHETGTLLVGYDAGDRRLVEQFARVAASFGATPRRVGRGDDGFRDVSARVTDGLVLDGDAWIDPDAAMSALSHANEGLGVSVVRQRVLEATTHGPEVALCTEDATYRGRVGVLATGASGPPPGLKNHAVHVVRPVRGMTVRLQGVDRSCQPTLRAFVRGRPLYLVSRPGGYCILGASSEEKGELGIEVGELQRLLRDALDLVPSLESATLLETRQGLRPASTDLRPFLERVEQRWIWAAGHYRHGVTLAPLAAADVLDFAEALA